MWIKVGITGSQTTADTVRPILEVPKTPSETEQLQSAILRNLIARSIALPSPSDRCSRRMGAVASSKPVSARVGAEEGGTAWKPAASSAIESSQHLLYFKGPPPKNKLVSRLSRNYLLNRYSGVQVIPGAKKSL